MVESAASTTKLTVSPDDSAKALRLGWSIAEVRGRFDPHNRIPERHSPEPSPPTLLLDSAGERSPVERQVEAVKILGTISQGGTTDLKASALTFKLDWASEDVKKLTAASLLRFIASRLIWSRIQQDLSGTLGAEPINPDTESESDLIWWDRMAWFLWAWDEAIQDQFATQTFGTASSYELGRGLSESYWALDPTAPEGEASSWQFLLGSNRIEALSGMCRRLAPVIGTLTAPALETTIRSWGSVAANLQNFIRPERALEQQVTLWRDLLLTGRDPLTYVDPQDLAKVAKRPWPLVKAFAWELGLVLAGALALGFAAAYLSTFSATLLTVFGAVGITASAVIGWAKTSVQKVAERVRNAVNEDMVVAAIQRLPEARGVPSGFPNPVRRLSSPMPA